MNQSPESGFTKTEWPTERRIVSGSIEGCLKASYFENTDALATKLLEVHEQSFPEKMRLYDQESMLGILSNPSTILSLLQTVHGESTETIGYILGYELTQESVDELRELGDTEMSLPQEKTLYVEVAGIINTEQGSGSFQSFFTDFLAEAKDKGYEKVTMHARSNQRDSERPYGLSTLMQEQFSADFKRTITNWVETGENFDYIELNLN